MHYKLGQACATNWGTFALLQIRGNVVINLGQLHHYKLGQVLLEIGAVIIN